MGEVFFFVFRKVAYCKVKTPNGMFDALRSPRR
jgi:hypothetical protein